MTVAILGSKGQLGSELVETARFRKTAAVAADLPEVNITDVPSVRAFIDSTRPFVIVNAAAYTHVDQAESDAPTAFAVNARGPEILARICTDLNIPLIHVSTDYVFDGSSERPYREKDPVNPLGVYGRSKEEGERRIRSHLDRHVILRTAWLYSPFGHNFVKTMLRLGKERERLEVVDDQYGCPTSARELAEAVLKIIEILHTDATPKWGTYHLSGQGVTTWYRFAQAVFALARRYTSLKVVEVRPVTTDAYPTPAKRPRYSVLDCARIQRHWKIHPRPWEDSLEETLHRIFMNPHGINGI